MWIRYVLNEADDPCGLPGVIGWEGRRVTCKDKYVAALTKVAFEEIPLSALDELIRVWGVNELGIVLSDERQKSFFDARQSLNSAKQFFEGKFRLAGLSTPEGGRLMIGDPDCAVHQMVLLSKYRHYRSDGRSLPENYEQAVALTHDYPQLEELLLHGCGITYKHVLEEKIDYKRLPGGSFNVTRPDADPEEFPATALLAVDLRNVEYDVLSKFAFCDDPGLTLCEYKRSPDAFPSAFLELPNREEGVWAARGIISNFEHELAFRVPSNQACADFVFVYRVHNRPKLVKVAVRHRAGGTMEFVPSDFNPEIFFLSCYSFSGRGEYLVIQKL